MIWLVAYCETGDMLTLGSLTKLETLDLFGTVSSASGLVWHFLDTYGVKATGPLYSEVIAFLPSGSFEPRCRSLVTEVDSRLLYDLKCFFALCSSPL